MGQDQDPKDNDGHPATLDEDTEGHKHHPYPATGDEDGDTEGHKHHPYPVTGDDDSDVEGHKHNRGA